MQPRLEYGKVAPGAMQAMYALVNYGKQSGLEPALLELVKIRASQLNSCAFCLDMHAKDARAMGETEQRIYALSAWRETPFYTERERAALALTEAVTLLANGPVSDEVYEEASQHFTEVELVSLVMSIVTINGWNRLSVTFRTVPGTYQPRQAAAQPVVNGNR